MSLLPLSSGQMMQFQAGHLHDSISLYLTLRYVLNNTLI